MKPVDPSKMCKDTSGNTYVCLPCIIIKITPEKDITVFAGKPETPGYVNGKDAQFNAPSAICIDTSNNLFVAERNAIRKISPDGVVTTFAGHLPPGLYGHANGVGTNALFQHIHGMCIDHTNTLIVCDNTTIRKVSPMGVVTTLLGSPEYY